ncbi:phosphonate degradation HD-domain oxygenase [Aliidongia dinghuensis]|nr:phosphonate degradation HD-domain oxygenase [Aliidongia dinghuensis]
MPMTTSKIDAETDALVALFTRHGGDGYFGERVTQAEHALQSAALAEDEGAAPALVVAALLHDVGHLIHTGGEDIADRGIDARHEAIGATYLARLFGPAVVEPVRLHVPAKRYLCAIDKGYWQDLSPASKQSLELQGGVFSPDEAEAFANLPQAQDAVRLRRWDDRAKVMGLETRPIESYRELIAAVMASHPAN